VLPHCHHIVTAGPPTSVPRGGILELTNEEKGKKLNRKLLIVSAALAIAAVAAFAATSGADASSSRANAGELTGAGSTFVAKLVQTWIPKVQSALGIRVTYGPIGSGGGINAITNRTVDFGASDAPLTPDQFAQCHGCVQIPWALSATSIPYHLPGMNKQLHLTGPILADIFLGKVTRWNDPRLRKINKGANLPNEQITVIHRSDSSGTSYNLSDYLSKVSPEWKTKVGRGTALNWPTGIGARGSSGISAALAQTNGGISYVDIAYSLANHFSYATLQNKAGRWTQPTLPGIKAAAKTINRVAAGNSGISIVNPSKTQKLAYPICTFTYVIVPTKTSKAADLKKFIHWALTNGQTDGPALLFSPLPKPVLKASLKTIAQVHS
jgi:phosphate transport system substrate-binding protein